MSDKMYGYEYSEVLTATTLDEFKEQVLEDNLCRIGESEKEILDRMEEDLNFPVKCVVYQRMELPTITSLAKNILESVIENLDENYRIGADEGHDISDAMRKASMEFALVIHKEYTPWNCDPIGEVILNRKDFKEQDND